MGAESKPTVTVIVPVYGVEAYLPKCIESVLSQSFRDFELILIDDGSPDNCGSICDQYAAKDARINVIHQANSGVSAARNAGLDSAKGTFISFCDADDYLDSSRLEYLIRTISNSETDSVVDTFQLTDESGRIIGRREHSEETVFFETEEERFRYIFQGVLARSVGWEICSRLFRKSIIDQHKIRFCESCGNFAEDLGFVLEYSFFSKGEASINHHSYFYLQRKESMMDLSRTVIKLNQVNEVSKHVYSHFTKAFPNQADEESFLLLHAAIMYNQMFKLLIFDRVSAKAAFQSVIDSSWMRRNLRGVLAHRKILVKYFGKKEAWRIILLSHYTSHQNPTIFRLERSLINRTIIRVD